MERFSALYDGDFAGHRVEVYGVICEQLCMIDGSKASWQWRYLSQVRSGKLDPSRRFARAIEIYHARLIKKELLVPVPACPICGLAHTHSHDEQVYDPARLATYDPATQEIKPLPQPSPSRSPRLVAAVNQPLYKWVKKHAASLNVTMADIIRTAMDSYKIAHTPYTQEELDYWYSDEIMELLSDE